MELAYPINKKSEVLELLRKDGKINNALLEAEVDWFFDKLGMVPNYFMSQSAEVIAQHISIIYANKMVPVQSGKVHIDIQQESADGAIFACNSIPGSQTSPAVAIERRIDERYLTSQDDGSSYRVQVYRSTGFVSVNQKQNLRLYIVDKANYGTSDIEALRNELDINKIGDRSFLANASALTKEIYQNILKKANEIPGPVIEAHNSYEGEKRIVICYRRGSTNRFFGALTDLYHYHGFIARRKYVEQFANGFVIVCISLVDIRKGDGTDMAARVRLFEKEANLIYILPSSKMTTLLSQGALSEEEGVYAHAAWRFAAHFINRMGSEYYSLRGILDMRNEHHAGLMAALKRRLAENTYTEHSIGEVIMGNLVMVKLLYKDFAQLHASAQNHIKPDSEEARKTHDEVMSAIKRHAVSEQEQQIFNMFLIFNRHILKTNFYKVDKVALSFRLNPAFLNEQEYPQRPFGIFYIIGDEFRGFHVRFSDVARGGVRIVRSRDAEAYATNLKHLFEECYGLANTQERKNKDIPEGGSKGVILLDVKSQKQEHAENAFKKYVDSLLDILLSDQESTVEQSIVDHYGVPEILFLGPDEGTAEMMDWASQRAKERSATFWKAFTTGKSRSLGGIPHDLYGMTTRSIHQYVVGILAKLGIKEEEVTKFQTGGPDGDLGSNEIKISKDKTIAIVDGSGVLYDEGGIDRTELLRLAEARLMVREFDRAKLSPKGFYVDVNDREVTLPDGTLVENGLNFRNEFHLNPLSSATLFVPCGGRPEAVNINNVDKFFHRIEASNGKSFERVPRFKYIVEGANIFFTQEARLILEEAGVIIFKDASANKGGVTSSSLEVLAALTLKDEEFHKHMTVQKKDDVEVVPEFYCQYIDNVHHSIESNAALEFQAVWNAHERTSIPRSTIADQMSVKINALNVQIQNSKLWDNVGFRNLVLSEACPPVLIQLIGGVEHMWSRVPENYLRAIFGAYLGSRYVYKYGMETREFDFFDFVQPYFDKLASKKE